MIDHKQIQDTLKSLQHARQDARRHANATHHIMQARARLCDALDIDREALPPELCEAFAIMLDWATAENERAAERVTRWEAEWKVTLADLQRKEYFDAK